MKVKLEFEKYFTPNNNHTCAENFELGKFCQFLMTSHFGLKHHCYFDMDRCLFCNSEGYLIPINKCIFNEDSKKDSTNQFGERKVIGGIIFDIYQKYCEDYWNRHHF